MLLAGESFSCTMLYKTSNKNLILPCHPYLYHLFWLWEWFATNELWVKLLLKKKKKRQFISVSKTGPAKKACLRQVKMSLCFTLEIQFQIFSAVSLVSSRNTFTLLNSFLSFATFLTFLITALRKDIILWMEVKITLNISNYSLFP